MAEYVIGVDYGTDSVRSVIIDVGDGTLVASAVFAYPRWNRGLYCDAGQSRYRQHPLDYTEGLKTTVHECFTKLTSTRGKDYSDKVRLAIRGIGIDTTGSTPAPVNEEGVPLGMLPEFAENPNALFWLWKDHTSAAEALRINEVAAGSSTTPGTNWLQGVGGSYSPEWLWAKAFHCSRVDQAVADAAFTWIEHSDWIPMILTGNKPATLQRNVCASGHKALWSQHYGGLPPAGFFHSINPYLGSMAERFPGSYVSTVTPAGRLSTEWAEQLNLSPEVVVCAGMIDAHAGAVGAGITANRLVKIMGTSTCDIIVVPETDLGDRLVDGICGQVLGSVLPGMIGLEAGQAAFGDILQWYVDMLCWPLRFFAAGEDSLKTQQALFNELSDAAAELPLTLEATVATDWFNGRRTPVLNPAMRASLMNLDLSTYPPVVFKALAEAACMGARQINEHYEEQGIPIKEITAIGGITMKSPYIMQMLADILQLSISVHRSEQACAAGAAMNAAVASGLHRDIGIAIDAMDQGIQRVYHPRPELRGFYNTRYRMYLEIQKFTEQKMLPLFSDGRTNQ